MTSKAMTDILRSHLAKEGLVLCKTNDTQFALDGMAELDAIRGIVELVDDLTAVDEWLEDMPTTQMPEDVLSRLTTAGAA